MWSTCLKEAGQSKASEAGFKLKELGGTVQNSNVHTIASGWGVT